MGEQLRPTGLTNADLDGDGDIDLATTNEDSNSIGLLANSGAATFAAPIVMATGVRPGDIAACDLDGNGSIDLVTSNRDSNSVPSS